MPSFDLIRTWENRESFRAQSVIGSFSLVDCKLEKRFKGSLPIEDEPWQIGVIVGRSGTGKTSIAKELFADSYINGFKYSHKCILDDFPEDLSVGDITRALCSVGFASPPDWLKSYEQLSQGEKMRVDIARALMLEQPLIVFDEFTSVVDREVAQVSAFAISKAIRKTGKRFIAVTCHYDVVDWLEPDWIFTTDTMEFSKKKTSRPRISLDIRRCSANLWRQFRQYHYLNSELSPFTKNYVALYKGKPIAFIAIMKVKMSALYYRVSRLVVLPDYQGIGIGKRFLNFMAQYYTLKTKLPFTIITSNPQLIRGNLEVWKITHIGRGQQVDSRNLVHQYTGSSEKRITVSLRYSPEKGNFRGQIHGQTAS